MSSTEHSHLFASRAPLILASASPRRRSLLEALGLRFEVREAAINEETAHEETPESFVSRLAEEKARTVSRENRSAWILAADTVVVLDAAILNKPANREEALAMLLHLSGRTHYVLTSFCLVHPEKENRLVSTVRTEVEFIPISKEICDAYIDSGEPMDKAGAYGIQGQGGCFVRRIEGSYSNVVGLPLAEVIQELLVRGVIAPARSSAGKGGIL